MGEALLQSTMSYYIINEIRVRLKTSLLLWCYFGSVFTISISNMLVIIFFNQLELYYTLPSVFLFILLFFFPLNLDIFSRESQLNMLDYLIMNSARFNTIYAARVIANALLMISPITIGFLSIFIGKFFVTDFLDVFISTPYFLGHLLLTFLFFLSWFMIAIIILSIIELKYPNSTIRAILYYFGLIVVIGSLILLNELLNTSSIITGALLGQRLFENLFVSFIEIIISCAITQLIISLVITRRLEFVERKIDQEMQRGKSSLKFSAYTLLEVERSLNSSSWRRIVPYFGAIPYILIFLMLPDKSRLTVFKESSMVVLGFHFFFILLYILLIVFPSIPIEKEFHMEELLLSRIPVNQYFNEKVTLLLRSIFFPFIVATTVIIILSWPFFFHLNFVFIILILIVRAFYFVSILIFIWRLIPSKNLVQTTQFSIIGLEIFGFLAIRFIIPLGNVFLIYSPIISSLIISQIMKDPKIEKYDNIVLFSIWMNVIIAILLFVGSRILIKADVRFE